MKIALLTDGIFPYVIGGMQKHSYYLAKYLAAAGHHVDLYHMNKSRYDISKLEFFTDAERLLIRSFVVQFPSMGKTPGHYIRESYEYSRRLFRLYRENSSGVDFIYAKGFAGWELLSQKSKGFGCPPVAVNLHGYEMFQPPPSLMARLQNRFLLKPAAMYQVRQADYLFSYGGKITDVIRSTGAPAGKIIEIPTGIEATWLNETPAPSAQQRKFVFVGRFERRKGIKELHAAIAKIGYADNYQFHFAGEVPQTRRLKQMNVKYHGVITEAGKMRELLRNCEVLVCPSYSEGMPNVIMEALASGCAVIATDVGAVSLMVNDANGLLIQPGNASQLGAAIRKMTDMEPAQLDHMRREAVRTVRENFLWETVAGKLVAEISKRLEGNAG